MRYQAFTKAKVLLTIIILRNMVQIKDFDLVYIHKFRVLLGAKEEGKNDYYYDLLLAYKQS